MITLMVNRNGRCSGDSGFSFIDYLSTRSGRLLPEDPMNWLGIFTAVKMRLVLGMETWLRFD